MSNATVANNATSHLCDGEELVHFNVPSGVNWWVSCFLVISISLIGIAGNCFAFPVLLSRAMSSVFNRLLVFLAVFDNVYLVCSLATAFKKYVFFSDLQEYLFIYVLHYVQSVAIVCSIYATVVLSVERYIAVSRPVQYHIMVNASGNSPWRRVLAYMVPTIVFAVIFNFPKNFELYPDEIFDGETNSTRIQFLPTKLRTHPDYVLYYQNILRFFVTGILPFGALLCLNTGIYKFMRKRRAQAATLTNSNSNTRQAEAEENRQALVLFFIVILFLVCNLPRIILNCYEVFIITKIDDQDPCFTLPAWVLIINLVNLVLMVTNSSINFFVYCFVNTTFRRQFVIGSSHV